MSFFLNAPFSFLRQINGVKSEAAWPKHLIDNIVPPAFQERRVLALGRPRTTLATCTATSELHNVNVGAIVCARAGKMITLSLTGCKDH